MAAYIKLFTDYSETFDEMGDAEAGRLIKALLSYGASGEKRTLSGAERLVFGIICRQIDRDNESADAHREAGRAGGRPPKNQTKPNETKQNQTEPNETKQNQTKADKDKDEDKDEDEDEDRDAVPRARSVFVPPTVEEVRAYCQEKGYDVDPELFVAHYETNGWKVGRVPMKNWRIACVTWSKNEYRQPQAKPSGSVIQAAYDQRKYVDRKPGEMPEWLADELAMQAAGG